MSFLSAGTSRGPVVLAALWLIALAAPAPAQSNFTFSYILAATQNTVPIQSGGGIAFPATPLNSVSQAALNITNTGGPAQVQNISISGSAFSLQGLPALPALVNTQQTLQVLIRYQPSGAGTDTGQVQVSLGGQGTQVTFGLQGTLSASRLIYQLTEGGQTNRVTPGGQIALPDTNLKQSTSATLTVQNTGNLSTTIGSITLSGNQDFVLSGTPVLPDTLGPNGSFTLKITFTPTQAVTEQASLAIGSDAFTLTGRGLGPNLEFAYTMAGTTVSLGTGDSVVFTPAAVTGSESAQFTISNAGTVAANIFNIGIVEPNSAFSVTGLPSLPLSIGPNANASFTISFAPTTVGFTTGTLRVGNTTIGLIGSGTSPPALPGFTFSGASGDVPAQSQPSIGLKLSKTYPAALTGTLTLTAASELTVDPAVQFSTGGRTVSFAIPANTTDAIFASQGPQIQLQTGTVASTLILTPAFATQAGNINLTPASPATLQLKVPTSAPALISVQVGSITTNSFVLTVVGYTTTRSLTTMNVQFTANPGFNVAAGPVDIDLSHVAAAWFAGTASTAFGGQFQVTVPFSLSGAVKTGQTLTAGIATVSATIANPTGTSNQVQATF